MPSEPSIALRQDERVLLSGGFGGPLAWGWTGTNLLMTAAIGVAMQVRLIRGAAAGEIAGFAVFVLVMAAIAGLPYLLSGTYWLTNRRLLFKPRLGAVKDLALETIDGARISSGVLPGTLKVPGKFTIRLRFVRGIERLWGGIQLFQEPKLSALAPRTPSSRAELVVAQTTRVDGLVIQHGVCVLRPGYAAFIPGERTTNLALAVAGGLLGAAAHTHAVKRKAKMPLDLAFELLREQPAEVIDDCVQALVRRFSGKLWRKGEAGLRVSSGRKRASLALVQEKTTVQGRFAQSELELAARLAHGWPEAEVRAVATRSQLAFIIAFAMLPLGLCVVSAVMGARAHQRAARGFQVVELHAALDRSALPEESLVMVRGTPDRTSKLSDGSYLFNLRGEDRLIVRAPVGELEKSPDRMLQANFNGQLRDMTESGWVGGHLPSGAIADFAKGDLRLASTAEVRVLDLGVGVGEARFEEIAGFIFAPMWGLAGVALLTAPWWSRRRRRV